MTDYAPESDTRSIWQNIGQLQAGLEGQKDRSGRIEESISGLEVSFNKRFDGLSAELKEQRRKAEADKTELQGSMQDIKDILLKQKARAGVAQWLLARVEFLLGIASGIMASLIEVKKL
jgi:uncharacterized protein HemX